MKGKKKKQLFNEIFQCSVICKIGHGSEFKNKDEKAYLKKKKKKKSQCMKEYVKI